MGKNNFAETNFGVVIKVFNFFAVVGYNREGFPPLSDTTGEVFLRCGLQ